MPYVRQKPVFTPVNFILATVGPDSSPGSVLCSAHGPVVNVMVGESVAVTVPQETCSEAEPTSTLPYGWRARRFPTQFAFLSLQIWPLPYPEPFLFLTFTFSFVRNRD